MQTVRIGLAGQVLVLAGLAATVGLGPAGWLAGLGHGVVLAVLLRGVRLGPADRVTLARACLVGGVTALAVGSGGPPLVALAAVALVLDRVDGEVARRTGTASPLGARFDLEVDAFLLLVLSATVGGWAIAIGAMRYAYVAAGRVLPWLPGPLPPRYWRKVVAAIQGIALVVVLAGLLPALALAGPLALLVESFGRDVRWRWRHRDRPAPRPRPAAVLAEVP